MANSIVEGMIPFTGPGFVAKENGNFQPGEYKRLCNFEIDRTGVLSNRRNVYSIHGESSGSSVTSLANAQRFLGYMNQYALIAAGTSQYMVGESQTQTLWNDLSASGMTAGSDFCRFVGFFRYNNQNFWLVLEFDAGATIGLTLYYDAAVPTPDVPATYAAGYQASLTREVLFTFAAGTKDYLDFQFRNFFIYKERLWIATSVGLYFSKSTDPTEFGAADDGGFFKYPGNTLNYALAIKDNVYVLCSDAVYAITYSTSPNTDATQRPLSTLIGGEMGCIHLDTPYFINNLGIFAINGTNVDKVMDSRFDYGTDIYKNHIWSFEEYLIVNKYSPVNYDNNYSPPSGGSLGTNLWRSPESDTVGGTQIDDNWTQANSPAIIRTNLFVDPNQEDISVAFWNNFISDMIKTRSSTQSFIGTHSLAVARTTSSGSMALGVYSDDFTNISPSTTYTYSVYVRPGNNTGTYRDVTLYALEKQNGVYEDLYQSTTACQGSTWTRISLTFTTTADMDSVRFYVVFQLVSGTSANYIDAAMLEQTSTLRPFFDGNTTDTPYTTYSWTGAANNSTSTASTVSIITDAIGTASDGQPGLVLDLSGTLPDADEFSTSLSLANHYHTWTYDLNPTSAITVGVPYTFRFEHRGVGSWNNGKLTLKVEYMSSAPAVISTTNLTIDSDYDPSASYATYSTSSLTLPSGTESVKFTFKLELLPVSSGTTTYAVRLNRFHFEKTSTYAGYFTGATTDTVDVTYAWSGTTYASESTATVANTHGYLKHNGKKFEPFLEGNSLGYNTYFINTENGSTHVLDFVDQYVSHTHGGAGFIVDGMTNPIKDSSGNYKWFFITNKSQSLTSYTAYPYFLNSSEDTEVNDYAVDTNNVLRRRPPKIDIEWDSFVPDGLEYRIKKFRSLLIQGVFPPTGMELDVYYDNESSSQTTELGDTETGYDNPRRHYAHRVGLNQRGRSITLRLTNPDWATTITSEFGEMALSDMRVLWTPTQRLPITKAIGS